MKNLKQFNWKRLGQVSFIMLVVFALLFSGLQLSLEKQSDNQVKVVLKVGAVDAYSGTPDFVGLTDVAVKQALDALPAAGGEIQLISPAYSFAATVSRAINNVTIKGLNGTTVTYAGACFSVGAQTGWVFQDLKIAVGGSITNYTTAELRNVTIGADYIAYQLPSSATASDFDVPTGRTATYVIAASDATASEKAQADVVCNGVDDLEDILDANALMPAKGGLIQLSSGTFTLSMGIGNNAGTTGLSDYVTLQGVGDGTIIKPKDQTATTLSAVATAGENHIHVASSAGFVVGEWIEISGAGGTEEAVYVASIDTGIVNLTTNLTQNHGIGDDVYSTWVTIDVEGKSFVTIKNLRIDGNTANWSKVSVLGCRHQYEISLGGDHASNNCKVDSITVVNGKRAAMCATLSQSCGIINSNVDSEIVLQRGNACYAINNIVNSSYIKFENAERAIVSNNQLYGSSILSTSVDHHSDHCICSSNIIQSGTNVYGGLYLGGFDNGAVSKNIITVGDVAYSANVAGIYIIGNDTLVSENQIDIESGATPEIPGILISASNHITLSTNIIKGLWWANRGIYLYAGDGYYIKNNDLSAQTLAVKSGVTITNLLIENNIADLISTETGVIPNAIIRNNKGWIAPGEIRTYTGTIGTLTQDAFNSLDNPFGQAVRVISLDFYISTAAGDTTPNSTIDSGIGSSATTDYTTLFEGVDCEVTGFYNSVNSATIGKQTVPQLWASGSGNRYLNMSIKDAAATGMVCKYTVTVMGN